MIKSFVYQKETGIKKDLSLEEIISLKDAPEALIWLDVAGSRDEEFKKLASYFKLHTLAVEDSLSRYILPKLEMYPDHIFLIWNYMEDRSDEELVQKPVSFFIGKNYLITVHLDEIEVILQLFNTCLKDDKYCTKGNIWLLYLAIDSFVDRLMPEVDKISNRLDELEDVILVDPAPDRLRSVMEQKRRLFNLRKMLLPEREVLNELLRPAIIGSSEMYRVYFQDIYDSLLLLLDFIETEREVVSGIIDIHISSTSNKLNEVMQKLTIVATIFMPITFVTGVYGMNFLQMPLLEDPLGFYLILLLMIFVTSYMLFWMRKKGWW